MGPRPLVRRSRIRGSSGCATPRPVCSCTGACSPRPRTSTARQWEHDVTEGGWTPDYWIDEARKLGASYIVLTTFHSRLGYARPWPSKIPGSCSTKRDFLGELIKAGKAKGVHVLLYMTDDPQWHNEKGVETLDSAAYSAYKGHQVDLTPARVSAMYSYDLFHEVMDKYPDLAGFWIDNDNEYWEQHDLYEQIRAAAPVLVVEQQQRGHADHGHRQQRAEDGHDAGVRLPAGVVHADAAAHRGRLHAAHHRRRGGTTARTTRSTTASAPVVTSPTRARR